MELYTKLVEDLSKKGISANTHFAKITDFSYEYLFRQACKKHGVEFEKISDGNFYFKKDGVYIGSNSNMLSSLISHTSISIAKNKYLTNKILKAAGVPVPKQKKFSIDQFQSAKEYISNQSSKVVVKPLDAKSGLGITVNVDSTSNLNEIWDYAVKAAITNPKVVLVEEMLEGIDIRAIVINGKFKCAVSRIPAHVVGDGISNVSELIAKKNEIRKKMPNLKTYLIKEEGSNHILKKNEILWLNNVTNIAQGAEAIDLTDRISEEIKALAEKAVRAIPGLNMAGLDLFANSLTDVNQVKVIEVNTYCNLIPNKFPYYGNGFDVFTSLIGETIKSFYGLKD